MYICYVVPFFTNKAVCMLYVCVSSDMFVFVYDVCNIYKHRGISFSPIIVNVCLSGLVYLYYVYSSKCLFVWRSLSVLALCFLITWSI